MPEPLDPTDALVSAFTDSFKRYGGFLAVLLGGHLLGTQAHAVPGLFAALPTMGLAAVRDFISVESWQVVMTWGGTLICSVAVPATWPFVALFVWQLARLRGEAELFQILFWTAVAQPPISFIIAQHFTPLGGIDLTIGVGTLVLGLALVIGSMLWWQHTSENALSPDPDTKSEL